jgi:hypothetical protein
MSSLFGNNVKITAGDSVFTISVSEPTSSMPSYIGGSHTANASISIAGSPRLVNLTAQEKATLAQVVKDNLQNASFSLIDSDSTLQAKVNNVVSDWLARNPVTPQSPQDIITVNTALAVGLPLPDTSTPVSGRGTGDKPYNPNISFDNITPAEKERALAQTARARLLDPKSKVTITSPGGSLIDTITGADLSVFFLTELPNVADIMSGTPHHLQRKELMLMEIDSVLSATYSIMREVFPVRSVGKMKPKSFVRGPVTISGSLAFTIFTEDVLVRLRTQMQQSINELQEKAAAVINAYRSEIGKNAGGKTTDTGGALGDQIYKNEPSVVEQRARDASANSKINKANEQYTQLIENYKMYNQMLNTGGIFMLNQLLPFHILIMGTTERGIFSKLMLKNIRVIDENQMQGVQQPNIVNRISFVAEDIFPLMTGNLNDEMSYSASADVDQNRIGANKLGIYTGSQVMNDIASMTSGEYRLKDK